MRRNVEASRALRRGGRLTPTTHTGGSGLPAAAPLASRTPAGGLDEERRRRLSLPAGGAGAGPLLPRSAPASILRRVSPPGDEAAPGGALNRARQIAAGYQPAVVKVVSYAHGVARASATACYVQREDVALETHDGRSLTDRDAVADEMKAWSTGFARRAESQDVVALRLTLHGVRNTPDGRDLYGRAIAAGLDGHRYAYRLDRLPSGALEARLVAVMAGPAKERFRVRDHRVGAGEGSFPERRLDPRSEAAVKARIGAAVGYPDHGISLVPGAADHGRDGVVRRLEHLIGASPAQDDRGRSVSSAAEARSLARDWASALRSQSARDTMHLVLSARAGTDVAALTATARGFLHDRFADHKFLFGVHTDRQAEGHVHVHAVVAVRNETGRKIHPGRETFREWREAFAAHAQAQGLRIVATSARERASSQSYGARDKIVVNLAERPRPTRQAQDRAYAQEPANRALIARARERVAAASANPVRIPRSPADREASAAGLAVWQRVAGEQPSNGVAAALLARLTLAHTLGGIVGTIGQRVEHLLREQHGMAIKAEQMAKDLRLMNEAVARTGDLLDGPTKQRFAEATGRYLETLANRLDLQRAQESGVEALTRPEMEALVGPNADRLLERARAVEAKEDAEAASARHLADRATETERRREGSRGRDPNSQRDLAAERAAAPEAAGRGTREANTAVEAARVLAAHPGTSLSDALVRTDALEQLKAEQQRLLRGIEAERPQGVKGQRMV